MRKVTPKKSKTIDQCPNQGVSTTQQRRSTQKEMIIDIESSRAKWPENAGVRVYR
jgi:hypothetical protein